MPSAPDLSQRQAEPTFCGGSSDSQATLATSDARETGRFSRCRVAIRRTGRSVERGATAVEYALMVGLIAVGIVTAVSSLRDKTTDSLNQTSCSTRGLIFPPRLKAGEEFKVKYIRNDTGADGWTSVGATGANHGRVGAAGTPTSNWDSLFKDGVEWRATLYAPSTVGLAEVQVRTAGVGGTILESCVLRVTP
jgi:Flp pilus assembly pilin Flp